MWINLEPTNLKALRLTAKIWDPLICLKCDKQIPNIAEELHLKYLCGKPGTPWKTSTKIGCVRCGKCRLSVGEFFMDLHKSYLCGKTFQKCLFCPFIFQITRRSDKKIHGSLFLHMNQKHGKTMEEVLTYIAEENVDKLPNESLQSSGQILSE